MFGCKLSKCLNVVIDNIIFLEKIKDKRNMVIKLIRDEKGRGKGDNRLIKLN